MINNYDHIKVTLIVKRNGPTKFAELRIPILTFL